MKDGRFVGGQNDHRLFEFFLFELSNKCSYFFPDVGDGNHGRWVMVEAIPEFIRQPKGSEDTAVFQSDSHVLVNCVAKELLTKTIIL